MCNNKPDSCQVMGMKRCKRQTQPDISELQLSKREKIINPHTVVSVLKEKYSRTLAIVFQGGA